MSKNITTRTLEIRLTEEEYEEYLELIKGPFYGTEAVDALNKAVRFMARKLFTQSKE